MRHHLTHLRAMDLLMAFLSVISVCLVAARWWGHVLALGQGDAVNPGCRPLVGTCLY